MKFEFLRGKHLLQLNLFLLLSLFSACSKIGHIGIDHPKSGGNPPPVPTTAPPVPVSKVGIPSQIGVFGATQAIAGACYRYDVKILDGNSQGVPGDLSSAVFQFLSSASSHTFSDSNCSHPLISAPSSATGTATVYLSNTVAENVVLKVTTTAQQNNIVGNAFVSFSGNQATQLALSSALNSAVYTCVPIVLSALDTFGNPTQMHSTFNVSLSLTGLTQISAYSDSACGTAISTLSMSSSETSKLFYLQSFEMGSAILGALTPGLNGASSTLNFLAGSTPTVALVAASSNIVVGTCTPVTAQMQRSNGSPLTLLTSSVNAAVSVVSGTAVALYADNVCSLTLPGSTLTIPVGSASNVFYVMTVQGPQTVSLSASAAGYLSGLAALSWIPVPATQLKLIGAPGSLMAGQCGTGQVALLDANNNPAYVMNNLNIALSTGTLNPTQTDFFSSTNCTGGLVNQVNLPLCTGLGACQNTVPFSFRPKLVGISGINVSSTGLHSASTFVNVTNPVGSPYALSLTRLTDPATAGSCLKYTVQTKDQYGNPVDISPTDLVLAATDSSLSGLGKFYSDLNCASPITQVTILTGTNQTAFYFKNTKAELNTLALTNAPLMVQDSVSTLAGSATKLVLIGVPAAAPATVCNGPFTVGQQDFFGNSTLTSATFNLSATNGVTFYSDAQCSFGINLAAISTGSATSGAIYFSAPTTVNSVLTAIPTSPASLIQSGFANTQFTTAPNIHLALSCNASDFSNPGCASFIAGSCNPVYAASFDASNAYFAPVGSTLPISMTSTSGVTPLFYSDATCSTALTAAPIAISPSHNPVTLYVKNTVAEAFTITASSAGTASANLALTELAASPYKLLISPSTGNGTFLTDSCSGPYSLLLQDSFGNAAKPATDLSINFASSTLNGVALTNAIVFSDTNCSNTAVTISSGSSSGSFYIKSLNAGSLTAIAAHNSLAQTGARNFAVVERAKLAIYAGSTLISGIDFGSVLLGTYSTQVVSIKNISAGENALVSNLGISGSGYSIQSSGTSCPSTNFQLSAGQSCTAVLKFNPTSTNISAGSLNVSYTSASDATPNATTLTLSGKGALIASLPLTLSASGVTYTNVLAGTTANYNISLTNPNAVAVSVTGRTGPATPFTVSASNPCSNAYPFTLAAGGSCTLTISYSPTVAGTHSSTFSYSFIDPNTLLSTNTSQVTLMGTAVSPVLIAPYFSLSSINYGNVTVGTSSTQALTLNNANAVAISITGISGILSPFSIVNSGTCSSAYPFTLAANSSCSLSVRFSPTALASYANSFTMTSSAGSTNALWLNGSGLQNNTAASLGFQISAVNFNNVAVGSYSQYSLLITNSGDTAATNIYFVPGGNFSAYGFYTAANTCSSSIAAHSSCFITLGFQPFYRTTVSSNFYLTYYSGSTFKTSSSISVSGTGY